ncbi:MAG: DUF948 domain-containing protein [Microbacteriaceae bacterium]|jgi:uncharacterized protein YoxC|nr:DUF948 domain-containing protein [Microbacteriaceae bacterium]MCI1207592.1 DUF948 domain-containing protein [Microbacteriaceae bacterium]
MTGGDIAGLIAAGVFLLLVVLLAVPLFKLGKLLDELRTTVHDLTDNVAPLLDETTTTVKEANGQLARVDKITGHVESITENVSGVVETFTGALASPLAKIAGLATSLRRSTRKRK